MSIQDEVLELSSLEQVAALLCLHVYPALLDEVLVVDPQEALPAALVISVMIASKGKRSVHLSRGRGSPGHHDPGQDDIALAP